MLNVRKDLCIGCGLCIDSCPRQAITMADGQARINQDRCNQCHLCSGLCPQGAIVEVVPVSQEELANTVDSFKKKTDELIRRIKKLEPLPS
jgi:ferredoxin